MELQVNFSPNFFGEIETDTRTGGKPTNIADSLRELRDTDFSAWDEMARSVFFKPGNDLDLEEVIEKILETNTVDGPEVPVGVYVDPAGEHQVQVWDDPENDSLESVCSYCKRIIRAGERKSSHGICWSCYEREVGESSGHKPIAKNRLSHTRNPQKDENTFDFGDGNGPVPAHHHPNGGGWVANTALVDKTAFVGPDALVSGNARVYGDARVYGKARVTENAWVYGNARVYENALVSGNAWVYGYAWVSGKAKVSGNAQVFEHARVSGDAWVSGNALVSGNARVSGNAQVYGDANVSGDAEVSGDVRVSGNALVSGDARVSGDQKITEGEVTE